jgi:predicted nucleotidyltransferase
MVSILEEKKKNSKDQISLLRSELSNIEELRRIERLTVFVAGSYARNEASKFSDIDLFFVLDGYVKNIPSPNIYTMRAFAKIIEKADALGFPAFSNDGEFLKLIEAPEMARELGGRDDDHLNYFTARMLMLLESKPVYDSNTYDHILREIVASYFRDYTHHPKDFRPVFLINDILRFWKTLCLNYEHKRNQPETDRDRKVKQKIKNFKLKFSRLLTCFGSIASIIDLPANSGPDEIINVGQLSPLDRLRKTVGARPVLAENFRSIEKEYAWFLETTNVHENALLETFHAKEFREEAFRRSEIFGDAMFKIVSKIGEDTGYTRYLII